MYQYGFLDGYFMGYNQLLSLFILLLKLFQIWPRGALKELKGFIVVSEETYLEDLRPLEGFERNDQGIHFVILLIIVKISCSKHGY